MVRSCYSFEVKRFRNTTKHWRSGPSGNQLVFFSREPWCFPRQSRGKHQDSRENKTNCFPRDLTLVQEIAWFVVIFGVNTTSDISKLLYVIWRAVRRVKFETILNDHSWYLCQISRTNHAIVCLHYYPQKFCNFHMKVFKLSWNTTALSQSNCRKFFM